MFKNPFNKNKLKQFDRLSQFNSKEAKALSEEVENKSLARSYDILYKIRLDAINGTKYTVWEHTIDDITIHQLINRGFNIDAIESNSGKMIYKIMW